MTYIMVDIESDGPAPGLFSMTELGAVAFTQGYPSFYAQFSPISDDFMQEALDVTSRTREEILEFPDPWIGMMAFRRWLEQFDRPMFISDNNGFDFQFVNYYFWKFLGESPFGHSSTNLGSLYKGMVGTTRKNFKHLRKTRHTHHPVDDAMGNIEALEHMRDEMGLNIS